MEKAAEMAFRFDHVHLKCKDIQAAKRFYQEMFSAKMVHEGEFRGAPMMIWDLGGAYIFAVQAGKDEKLEPPAKDPRSDIWVRYGIGHIGVIVKDLEKAARELRAKGAEFILEPQTIRDGVKAAFIRAPDGDAIEIVERNG